ncbi:MAG TPA: hypothetical protein VMX57_06525, partial [Planctomycetota bacterium]|nr:hypothetical protein [Planctomycetota bacterium]
MKRDDGRILTRLMHRACAAVVVLCVGLVSSTRIVAQEKTDKAEKRELPAEAAKPVATGNSEVAKLLREWFAEGTAAGNIGDWYDNRDGRHSYLGLSAFPQLSAVEITEREREWAKQRNTRPHWGPLGGPLYPHVTFGNSSTSGTPPWGCSNPRYCILSTQATAIHYVQYVRSHLYIFPEHRDHDPGRNGRGGWGDLYHAN